MCIRDSLTTDGAKENARLATTRSRPYRHRVKGMGWLGTAERLVVFITGADH